MAGTSFFTSGPSGQPITWAGGTVTYDSDQGHLSPLRIAPQADAFVAHAFSRWTAPPSVALIAVHGGQLAEDVSGQNPVLGTQQAIAVGRSPASGARAGFVDPAESGLRRSHPVYNRVAVTGRRGRGTGAHRTEPAARDCRIPSECRDFGFRRLRGHHPFERRQHASTGGRRLSRSWQWRSLAIPVRHLPGALWIERVAGKVGSVDS